MADLGTDVISWRKTLPSVFSCSDHTYDRISVDDTVSSPDVNNNTDESYTKQFNDDTHPRHGKDTGNELNGTCGRWSLNNVNNLKEQSSGSGYLNQSLNADTFEKYPGSGSAYFSLKAASSSSLSVHQTYPKTSSDIHAVSNDGELKDNVRSQTHNTTRKTCSEDGDPSPEHAVDTTANKQEQVLTPNNALPQVTNETSGNGPSVRNVVCHNNLNRTNPQHYIDVLHRCDRLINRLQLQNQEHVDLISTCNRFRKIMYLQTGVFIFGGILLISACLVSRYGSSMVQGAKLQNLTAGVNSLQNNYIHVTDLVTDALTRSRSFIHLNSDYQLEEKGERHTMKWDSLDITRKGTLELSNNKQGIVISTGAFYDIYCKVHFSISVNETRDISLAYEVVHRRDNKDMHKEYAFHRHTAVQGKIRQDLSIHSTRYLVTGDVIAITVSADHWQHVAKYQGASSLILHELT